MYDARPVWAATISIAAMVSGLAVEAAAQQATPYVMQGRVVDEKGNPLAGAEVVARYQLNPGDHTSYQETVRSGADGSYSISLKDRPGTWSGYAYANIGNWQHMRLVSDSYDTFAGNDGAIRNFRIGFEQQTPDDSHGTGGMIVVDRAPLEYPDLDKVQLTLRPVKGGATITRSLRQLGEGHVATGLPPGPYEIKASLGGQPMLVGPDTTPKQWASSYTADFEPKGGDTSDSRSAGVYWIHVLVKQASGGGTPGSGGGGSTPPPGGGSAPPPPPPATIPSGYLPADAQPQHLGLWNVRSTGVYYPGESQQDVVKIAFVAKNDSLFTQSTKGAFSFQLNNMTGFYSPSEVKYEIMSAPPPPPPPSSNPYIDATRVTLPSSLIPVTSVKAGEEMVVHATFRVKAADRPSIKSVTVTGTGKVGALKTSKASTVIALPAGPEPTKPPKPDAPLPVPKSPPAPSPSDPIPVAGDVYNLARWAVRVSEVHFETPKRMKVSVTAKNKTLLPLSPLSTLEFTLNGRTKTAASHVTYSFHYEIAATKEVVMTAWFDVPEAEQEAVHSITVTEVAQPKKLLILKAISASSVTIPVQAKRRTSVPPAEKTSASPIEKTDAPPPAVEEIEESTDESADDGFRDTGYFMTRLDTVKRDKDGAVGITLTMRNDQNVRRSIWNNYNTWTLIGSDGLSYKHDGNGYGRDSSDVMKSTVWLDSGDSGVITYVYRKLPFGVKPVRLVVRDYDGEVIAEYDLP